MLRAHIVSLFVAQIVWIADTAWSCRSYACHALRSWICWILQCHWSEIYTNHYGGHSFSRSSGKVYVSIIVDIF